MCLSIGQGGKAGVGGLHYRYNGIEHEENLRLDLTMFRTYDPVLGRFNSVDYLAEFMPSHSPYSFGFNNPIIFTDKDGLAPGPPGLWRWIKSLFSKKGTGCEYNFKSKIKKPKSKKRKKRKKSKKSGNSNPMSSSPPQNDQNPPAAENRPNIPVIEILPSVPSPSVPVPTPTLPEISITPTLPPPPPLPPPLNLSSPFVPGSDQFSSTTVGQLARMIANQLNSDPTLVISIRLNTDDTDGRVALRTIAGSNSQQTINTLLTARGRAIQRALLNLGVNPDRIGTYFFRFNQDRINTTIIFRRE